MFLVHNNNKKVKNNISNSWKTSNKIKKIILINYNKNYKNVLKF